MKVIRVPVAEARKNMASIVRQAQNGTRVKVTRYNKTLVGLIGTHDLKQLEDCEAAAARPRKKRPVARRRSS